MRIAARLSILVGMRLLIVILLFVANAIAFGQDENEQKIVEDLTYEDIRALSEIFARVRRDYVDEVGAKELYERAMRGMVSELDPYSTFLTEAEYEALEDATLGRYGGVGIEVEPAADGLIVMNVTPESPAGRAGLEVDDRLVAIDGESIEGLSFAQVRERVRGEPATVVEISIQREGISIPLKFSMAREYIPLQSVSVRQLEGGVAYVNVDSFRSNTLEAVRRLLKPVAENATAILLDLRGNSGGLLNAGIGLADLFVQEGVIVSTRGRDDRAARTYFASEDTPYADPTVLVLVDKRTASAAEIVAGALQDLGRARVAGAKTFGKGSVQTIQPLINGSAIKMTTSRYYTPSGRSIHEKGIQPDVLLDGEQDAVLDEAVALLRKEMAGTP